MERLHGTKVDEKKWKVIKTPKDHYVLLDKEKDEFYYFKNVIGFEQVSEDEFLVYSIANADYFKIARYKLMNNTIIELFSEELSLFDFITEDRILFRNWGNSGYFYNGVYSIKENKLLEEAKWLNFKKIEVYEDTEDVSKTIFYVEDEIISLTIGNQKLIYTVDPNTLEPICDCYSEFRNDFVKVNNKEDISRIKKEDIESIQELEQKVKDEKNDYLNRAKELILSKTNDKIYSK